MIRLKNGYTVDYNSDFDNFFKILLDSIIRESRSAVDSNAGPSDNMETLNEAFLKELMDNCIFVTHQIFTLSKECEELSKFMVSGFIFNSLLLMIQTKSMDGNPEEGTDKEDEETIH